MSALRRWNPAAPRWEIALLIGVVVVAAVLRLWNVGQNLPYVYNIDESARFVPDAASYFSERLGFRELVNPPGLMGLLGIVDQVWFRLQGISPTEALLTDPSQAYLVGRVLVVLLSVAALPVFYLAGRRLVGRTAALVAVGLLAVAFLPVAYSRLALSDGPTLLFMAIGLLGGAMVLQESRTRGFVVVGVAVGLAAGFKYNAGIVVLVGLAAAALRVPTDGWPVIVRRTLLMGVAAAVAFVVANPYVLIDPAEIWRAIEYQQAWSSGGRYVGEPMTDGFRFYIWSATWGVGWAPLVAAVVGAGLLAWRRWRIAVLLLPMVVLYLLVMGTQDRFFARWLLPIVPIMCLTAGFAVQELIGLIARRGAGRPLRIAVAAVVALGLGAQSLIHSAHTADVVGRDDTRTVLRDWMFENIPARDGVVLESMSPRTWNPTFDGFNSWYSLTRWSIYHTIPAVQRRDRRTHPQSRIKAGFSSWVQILYPKLLDEFERYGYCWVVTSSYQAGRAARTPGLVPEAVAFYKALARRGQLVWQVSPFAPGANGSSTKRPLGPLESPVPYQIDRQATSYELAYERPGPAISVYRLNGGRCSAGPGTPVIPNAPWN